MAGEEWRISEDGQHLEGSAVFCKFFAAACDSRKAADLFAFLSRAEFGQLMLPSADSMRIFTL